ncbi:MAG TPA: 2-hydroxyglutaryl-CoA dehydratase, partial [bacterium]|nr:2-hydroxyglutaryl-CoA dehydratase [bacterium]
MDGHFYLGLDLGSVSLNCIITDESGSIIFKRYVRTSGLPVDATLSLFKDIANESGDISFSGAVIAGSGKELITKS